MTSVGGDLALVGDLAAKVVVTTILEREGYREHRLAGDYAIVGLHAVPGLAKPFDIVAPRASLDSRFQASGWVVNLVSVLVSR